MKNITLCALIGAIASGCIKTSVPQEPKPVEVHISSPKTVCQSYENRYPPYFRIFLPNGKIVRGTEGRYKHDDFFFCSNSLALEESYIEGKVTNMMSSYQIDPPYRLYGIETKNHSEYNFGIKEEENHENLWIQISNKRIAVPTVEKVNRPCDEKGAQMYRVLKQWDSIDFNLIKILPEEQILPEKESD